MAGKRNTKSLINNYSDNIDAQIKALLEKKREHKKEATKYFFNTNVVMCAKRHIPVCDIDLLDEIMKRVGEEVSKELGLEKEEVIDINDVEETEDEINEELGNFDNIDDIEPEATWEE